jgi:4-hydroxy-tetrahydrodipicolinate synthase
MRAVFKGSMPALVTPFKDGQLDLDTLKKPSSKRW